MNRKDKALALTDGSFSRGTSPIRGGEIYIYWLINSPHKCYTQNPLRSERG